MTLSSTMRLGLAMIVLAIAMLMSFGRAAAMTAPEPEPAGYDDVALMVAGAAIYIEDVQNPEFADLVLESCEPVFLPGTFVGCEAPAPDGERWYAGIIWIDNEAEFATGP
jgi:hypothetical protein